MKVMLTGGLGFMGSALAHRLLKEKHDLTIIDKLTYAGSLDNMLPYRWRDQSLNPFRWKQEDVADYSTIDKLFKQYKPDVCYHLAAESAVDKSIENSSDFVMSNVVGTHSILEACKNNNVPLVYQDTDEVFGAHKRDSIGQWTEDSPIQPRNPYSASKAGALCLVQSYSKTYKMPIKIARSCNVYGPRQAFDKLIPRSIRFALQGKPIEIYPDGFQTREWIFVEDYVDAFLYIAAYGKNGESYNISTESNWTNLEVADLICSQIYLEECAKGKDFLQSGKIIFKGDRLGHDDRYAMSSDKLQDLGWQQKTRMYNGISKTIEFYKGKLTK